LYIGCTLCKFQEGCAQTTFKFEIKGVFGTVNPFQFLQESVESEPNNVGTKRFCSERFGMIHDTPPTNVKR
jgi:hypothetical protein